MGAVLFFKIICRISRSRGTKNRWFWPALGVSGLWLHFEFTDGYEMMHRAWKGVEGVSYCISRSSVKFQGHTVWKTNDLAPNWAFPFDSSNSTYWMATKWHTQLLGERKVPYWFSRSSIKFQCQTARKLDLDPILARLLGRMRLYQIFQICLVCIFCELTTLTKTWKKLQDCLINSLRLSDAYIRQ